MSTAIQRTLPHTLLTAVLALTGTFASFAATTSPLHAAARGAYAVTLSAPLARPRQEILDGTMWRCTAERCLAPADGERAVSICGKVARKFGAVAHFATPQGELSAEDLARCNAAA